MKHKYIDGAKWESDEAGTWTHPGFGSVIGDGKNWWAVRAQDKPRNGPYPTMTKAAQWLASSWSRESVQREKRSTMAKPRSIVEKPPCDGDVTCKTHKGGMMGADPKRESRRKESRRTTTGSGASTGAARS